MPSFLIYITKPSRDVLSYSMNLHKILFSFYSSNFLQPWGLRGIFFPHEFWFCSNFTLFIMLTYSFFFSFYPSRLLFFTGKLLIRFILNCLLSSQHPVMTRRFYFIKYYVYFMSLYWLPALYVCTSGRNSNALSETLVLFKIFKLTLRKFF